MLALETVEHLEEPGNVLARYYNPSARTYMLGCILSPKMKNLKELFVMIVSCDQPVARSVSSQITFGLVTQMARVTPFKRRDLGSMPSESTKF